MGFFNRRPVRPAGPNVGEPCDRCPQPAQVRVGKRFPIRYAGAPNLTDTRELDLVFCGRDFAVNEEGLRVRAWRVLDDKRELA